MMIPFMTTSVVQLQRGALDLQRGELRSSDGSKVRLTSLEVGLVGYLAARPGQIVPRDELLGEVWGYAARTTSRAVDTTMARLRRKVERDSRAPYHFITVHGTGYRFVALDPVVPETTLLVGRWEIDLAQRTATREGATRPLSGPQASLLTVLADARGHPVAADTLFHRVFQRGPSARRALVSAMYRLRQLLEDTPTEPRFLLTTREGYRLLARRPGERRLPPQDPGPFVGRDVQVGEILEALDRHRVVTLHGIGGIGKSRLAAEVARAEPEERAVVWISLSGVAPGEVLGRIARALGGAVDAAEIAGRLAEVEGLVVIDEAEGGGEVLGAVLAEGRRVLVTSRVPLQVPAEHAIRIEPIADAAAMQLLDALAPPNDDAAERATLVRWLEGIPLALVLAARRLARVSAAELAERMDQRLQLLDGGQGRQRSLLTVLEETWDALDAVAREVWAQLSVLRGSFDLQTAEAIVACRGWVVDPLERLGEHAIIEIEPHQGRARYAMLETVRQFGASKLTPEERSVVKRRLSVWACERAQAHRYYVHEGGQLYEDWPNLQEGWDPDGAEPPLTRIVARFVLRMRGFNEAHAFLDAALARRWSVPVALERAQVLYGRGDAEACEEALAELREQIDDPRDRASLETIAARNAYRQGRMADSVAHARASLRGLSQGAQRNAFTIMLVGALLEVGKLEEAEVVIEPLLQDHDPNSRAHVHYMAAAIADLRHDLPRAISLMHQAVTSQTAPVSKANYRAMLAEYLAMAERFDEAEAMLEAAERLLRRWPDRMCRCAVAGSWAVLRLRQWRLDEAVAAFQRSEALTPIAGGDAWVQLWVAAIRAVQGRMAQAKIHAAQAEALPSASMHAALRSNLAPLWGEPTTPLPYTGRDVGLVKFILRHRST
ncbi:MAG: winged helix-turn-helix domain-containing protein [Myxococcota bacterium]